MSQIQNYRDLEVWQRGVDLTLEVYNVARRLPQSEQYELSRQIRRAAASIPANLAEGHERRGKGFLHHVRIALGSLAELETHIEVALRLGFLKQEDVSTFARDAIPLRRMLHGLGRSLMRRFASKAAVPAVCVLLLLLVRFFV